MGKYFGYATASVSSRAWVARRARDLGPGGGVRIFGASGKLNQFSGIGIPRERAQQTLRRYQAVGRGKGLPHEGFTV